MAIRISAKGVDFICNFEGFRATAYKDTGGVWTVGFGSTGTAVKEGTTITEEQAKILMAHHLDGMCADLDTLNLPEFFPYQQDAIASLVYNIGVEEFKKSEICERLLELGDDLTPWLAFVRDSKGSYQSGLVLRRIKELKLFVYGKY